MKIKALLILLMGFSFHAFSQLSAPSLSSPADKSTFYVGTSINFSWTSVIGATSYDIEFDTGTGYVYLTNVSTGTSWNMALSDINAGQHNWHVRAKNSSTVSQWSSSRYYAVIGVPSIPTTTNPSNGSTIQYSATTNFTWNNTQNAAGYQIQFDAEPPVPVSGTFYSRSFTTLGDHSWKVLATNPAGNGDWSATKVVTVILGTPTPSSPANGANYYVGSTINFSWTTVSGATSYDVEFDAGLGYASTSNVTGTSLSLPLGSINAGPHTWHVRAVNGSTVGSWSSTRSYSVIGLPAIPTTTSPVSGSTIYYEIATNFTWNKANNATSYQIQFDTESPVAVSGTSYSRTFNVLGDHIWKVKSTNDAGDSDWSTIKIFTLSLAPPSLSSPNNGLTSYIGSTLNFSWTPVLGASSYDVEFDAGLGAATLTNMTATSLQWALVSANIGTHTWHVRAKNGTNPGPWSSSRTFSVAGLPGIPVLVNPPAESIINYDSPTNFNWNPVPNTTGYLLQFDAETPIVVAGTSYTRSFNTPGSHIWKVKATNPLGESDWSPTKTFNISLGTPSLSSPANASISYVGETIDLSWTSALGATSYDIEFDAGMGYVSLTNVTTSSMSLLLGTTSAGPHTWHVRAKNGATVGLWSQTRTYTVIGKPTIPVTGYPPNGSNFSLGSTINFYWNAVNNASSYKIQFDAEPPVIVSGTSFSRSFTTPGEHTWKVLASNNAGDSGWSTAKTLNVGLSTPSLSSPANGSTFYVGSTINFTWTSVIDATSYDIELDASTGFVSLTNVTGTSMSLILVAANAGPHTWHVRARYASSVGMWSSSRSYTVIGLAEIPATINPANGASVYSQVPVNFAWSAVANATGYQIQFDAESPLTVSGANYSRTFSELGSHTWKVKATNAAGESGWSPASSFTVVYGIPNLITPANASVYYIGSTINFSWTLLPGATSYDIELDAGTTLVSLSTLTGNSMDLPTNASNIGQHSWHIRAKYGSAIAPWSSTRSFAIVGIPAIPTIVSPVSGSILYVGLASDFTWKGVLGASSYQIQFDTESPITVSGTNYSRTFDTQGDHTWKVKAVNAAGESDWSPSNPFIVSLGSPSLPTKILSVIPDNSWDFGNVTVNNANEKTFDLQNTGNSSLTVSNLSISGTNADQFVITAPSGLSFDIPAGGVQQVTIRFKPTSAGLKSAFLSIVNNSGNASPSKLITINGTGTLMPTKTFAVDPDGFWDFGNVTVNNGFEKIFTVKNSGTAAMSISGLSLTGANSDQFTITNPTNGIFDIPAGGIQQVTIRFKPTSSGLKIANFIINNNSDNASPSETITLNGTGSLLPTKILTVSPDEFSDFGIVTVNNFTDKTFTFQNNGTANISITGLSLTGTNSNQFSITAPTAAAFDIPAGGIQQVTIRFKPVTEGWKSAIFTIANNADNVSPTKIITLNGTGSLLPSKILTVSPGGFWDYGTVTLNTDNYKIFTTQNTGSVAMSVTGLSLTGVNSDQFIITSPTTNIFDIPSGGTQQIIIRFKPSSEGWKSALLSITNNSDNAPSKLITLNGTGVIHQTPIASSVNTNAVTSVTATTADGGGNVTSDGGASVTARGVCWSTTANPTISDPKTSDGAVTGLFSSKITGLSAGTTYHVRAYATNAVGTSYGADVLFTTQALATVTTAPASAISSIAAISGGNVTSDGGASVIAKGICWGSSASPTISDSKTLDGTGIGAFNSRISGLTAGTTYHVRAYATNSVGTSYGPEVLITTQDLPSVTTISATATVSPSTSASGKGNVTSDGGATVTEKGLCWNTTANPTTSDSKTSDGSGIGSFTDIFTGLTPGTTYHVRAYATNSVGTAYGEDISFKTTVNGGVYNISSFYHIYPNPSHGRITVLSSEEIAVDLKIYSLDGVLLIDNKLLKQENILDLNLKKGVYLITLKSAKANGSYQLIIL